MAPKFGTSGLRGLVTELTPDLVADHVRAFLRACPNGGGLHLGRDLRSSSPALADVVARTARSEGLPVTDCGALPTPALALAALNAGQAAIMVTGSHIPDDRNGLKFYTPEGEITKADEAAILSALGAAPARLSATLSADESACARYAARYSGAYGGALIGLRVGVWQHSSVARDLLCEVLSACGAQAVPLGRSDRFLPVDTEAIEPEWRDMFAAWAAEHRLDALISTDGDADRPLMADETGQVIPGDVLGALTAEALAAETVVTTVSANTCIDLTGRFRVIRTRIGSPYVIADMAPERIGNARVVGYEPNGGFLLGFAARGPCGPMPQLRTRDCLLPLLAPLAEARARGLAVSALAARLPARFTATARLQGVEPAVARAFLAGVEADPAPLLAAAGLPALKGIDRTDGWRGTAIGDDILHLRPSGNAPEFRIYAEAATAARAEDIAARACAAIARGLDQAPPRPDAFTAS
ncbi:phosphomannomutase [Rhodobacter sp. Har01]|uniref:phosphomannomutase n=1 Tax=Rhodobacter sp. Har01 TaxID=2883999 RepID=UPI001D08E6A2|nr:phosphomannomutase [Rhodobacter sp. Har01]MCB6178392.1 phosphomannomutase [Rhodobacter sp. Har01]